MLKGKDITNIIMIKLPKCRSSPNCEQIAYMIRSKDDNPLKKDLFICETCMSTTYSAEHCEPIPKLRSIDECLNMVIFNIDEIVRFKDQQNLDEAWDGFLPDLETFKDVYIDLKKKYKKAEEEKQWWTFVYLLSDARALLNLIFDCELMKHYNRHLHSRSYQESKRGIIQTVRVGQSFMRNKLSKLEEDLTNNLIAPLKEKLRRTTEENDRKDHQIEVMKEEQKRLEQIEQTLQEKDMETIQKLNETIEFKSQEEAKRTAQIDELQHQITSLESTLEESKHTLDHAQLKAIHNSITNSTTTFDSSSSLKFDLDEASSQTLLEALQLNTLPPLNKLSFKYTREYYRPEPISKFLLNAVPQGHNSLRKFVFDADNSPFVSVRRYLRAFERVFIGGEGREGSFDEGRI